MTPEELLRAENLPGDLKWVSEHFRLNPRDPVYLLIAWHWLRVKGAEDTLRASILEMKTMLDARVGELEGSAKVIAGVNTVLKEVRNELAGRPAILGKELETQLKQPVAGAVAQLTAMQQALAPVAKSFRTAQRRELLAALLTGAALGAVGTVVLVFA
jgi:hypothetical protein